MRASDLTTSTDVVEADVAEPPGALQRGRHAQPGAGRNQMVAASGVPRIAGDLRSDLLRRTQEITQEVARLKDLAVALERWHQDMISLMTQNRDMRGTGEDLASIVKHLIMLSLNAAVEAARAGESARGFVVVAAEVRSLSMRAQILSKGLGKNLHKNDLIATATFQDLQAGGKLMMAAISGLESMVRQLHAGIG